MAAGDLVTADWQMEYRGLLLGDGSPYSLVQVDGLLAMADLRTADRTRLRRHGLTPGEDFLSGRTVRFMLEVSGDTAADFQTAMDNFLAATRPGDAEEPLVFQFPGVAGGGKRRLSVRPRRRNVPITTEFYYRLPVVDLEVFATDPRIYADQESSATSALPSAGGGLNFPETPPLTFGAVATGGTISAYNAGTFPTSPTMRVDGPVTNPRITNVTAGRSLSFTITMASGEWLEVDTDRRTVLLNGTASRYNTLDAASQWWDLDPGVSEVTFQASTSTAATLALTWRSAWA